MSWQFVIKLRWIDPLMTLAILEVEGYCAGQTQYWYGAWT